MKERFPTTKDLALAIARGDNKEAVAMARQLLARGLDVELVVEEGLTKALESLDVKCNNEQFSLLEILLAGRAMMDVMEQVICRHISLSSSRLKRNEVVILGTIKGDVHDLGKNIVGLMLKVCGYKVVDLGKDVDPLRFVEAAAHEGARYIGVSSLITTTVDYVKEVKKLAVQEGLKEVRVLAGGAALRQAEAGELNVDYVAQNVFNLLQYLKKEGE
ncbi:cobalamin B12-binding domain-containing protein [Thermanaeromonas sp. C210]|uniref:cobalamin B12-binding domain-containing protein n=1 Tax=Thermanaeromonas sp. C210 TaxID=2731925 RepID=UPI00155B6993|nr:cobalamin-dependent protein [Thermanaeromonas sp. C210]GFN22848.1 hypothetical protein TAMC210_11650 [Thermanaeromonas sp. C210]